MLATLVIRLDGDDEVHFPTFDDDAIAKLSADKIKENMVIINAEAEDFRRGVALITQLTEGKLYVCKSPDAQLPIDEKDIIEIASFSGPHPAGLVGTHIHFLCPVSANRMVWHIGYQDVIAIGYLFNTGRRDLHKIISLAGSAVRRPRWAGRCIYASRRRCG